MKLQNGVRVVSSQSCKKKIYVGDKQNAQLSGVGAFITRWKLTQINELNYLWILRSKNVKII